MGDITLAQKKLLEPYGQLFADIDTRLRALSDEELTELLEAAYKTSTTNCWCCTFDAANYLKPEIRNLLSERKFAAKRAEENSVSESS